MDPSGLPVSRETGNRLREFVDLLLRWNKRINLIGRSDTRDVWERHISDSIQLFPLISQNDRSVTDLGSGGGFPGLVIAILAKDAHPSLRITLVEADTRKCAFLFEASRALDLAVDVKRERIEDLKLPPQDVITARALARVKMLFFYSSVISGPNTKMLFLKGSSADQELTEAAEDWHSHVERFPSQTSPDGVILKITELRRYQ